MIARTWRQPAKHTRMCAEDWKHESDSRILDAILLFAAMSGGCLNRFCI